MGVALPRRRFLLNPDQRYVRPLVFCCEVGGYTDEAVSLNVPLAERLLDIEESARSRRLGQSLLDCLDGLPQDVAIRDFDVLFNPSYEVDVLAVLTSTYRRHRFDVVWPGSKFGHELLYAEEGFPDYHSYDIRNYDITCIF